ncbi:hypothetical protein SSYM_2081, partial [Serratia symbiotica str. Tucson]
MATYAKFDNKLEPICHIPEDS